MEVIRDTYYHRPGPGMRLVRLGRDRNEAVTALAKWKRDAAAEKLASADPWLRVQRQLLASMRARCRERDWTPLTREELASIWARANGCCEVTGIPFSLERSAGQSRRPWAPSLDRRDCGKPYTCENSRLVCTAVNIAMNEWGEGVLMRIAKALRSK